MAKLALFGYLEKYLFTLFCFELRKAQKPHCAIQGDLLIEESLIDESTLSEIEG